MSLGNSHRDRKSVTSVHCFFVSTSLHLFLCVCALFLFEFCFVQEGNSRRNWQEWKIGKASDTIKFLRHIMRAILSVQLKCSHRRVSHRGIPSKTCANLKSSSTRPECQPSKPLLEQDGLNRSPFVNCSGLSLSLRKVSSIMAEMVLKSSRTC